jgi:chloride channel protein, CIC family
MPLSERLRRLSPTLAALRGRLALAALRLVPTEAQRLLALTIVIGGICGLVAVAFHEAIRVAEDNLIGRAMFVGRGGTWIVLTLALPTVGGLVVGAVLQYVLPTARGSGIPQVKASYAGKLGRVRLRDAVGKFFLSTLQIGSGASLGREGPTVQICAGIATALGRLARVSPQAQRKLLPVGAAAGVAAAFNAPIAAVTFTIEEIVGKLDETVLSGVIVAAALAAVVERSILGGHPVFDTPGEYGLDDARSLLLYAALGVTAAIVSIIFTDVLLGLRRRFRKLRWVPAWARPGLGGFVTGALAVAVILTVNTTGVTGGGYATLARALEGGLPVKVMLVLGVAKLLATSFSYSSGGAGGVFAPTLFVGAMVGGAFGSLDVQLFGHSQQAMGAFALVGMGAVFSGTIRAPMTSVLIIVEMTSGYGLILPLMIANMSAYIIARRFRPKTIYEALLAQDGIHLEDRELVDALERLTIADLVVRDRAFVSFEPGARAGEVLSRTSEPSWQDVFPVLDVSARMIGVITNEELRVLGSEPELSLIVNATDLMRPPVGVLQHEPLRKAFEIMRAEGIRELPVLDADGRIVGFIDEGSLAHAYLRASAPRSSTYLPTPPPSER